MTDDEMYTVEKVLDKRPDPEHGEVFLVKWKDYSDEENSWEPRENFISSGHLIDEFEEDRKVCLVKDIDIQKKLLVLLIQCFS